jgi:hypothetical protein
MSNTFTPVHPHLLEQPGTGTNLPFPSVFKSKTSPLFSSHLSKAVNRLIAEYPACLDVACPNGTQLPRLIHNL